LKIIDGYKIKRVEKQGVCQMERRMKIIVTVFIFVIISSIAGYYLLENYQNRQRRLEKEHVKEIQERFQNECNEYKEKLINKTEKGKKIMP
jgi:hypothetical protein